MSGNRNAVYIHWLKKKYERISRRLRSRMFVLYQGPLNQRIRYGKEISHLKNEIESYGFGFYPEHYVEESVNKLDALLKKIDVIASKLEA